MNTFYFLFGIYFLAIFTMPCGDIVERNAKPISSSIELTSNDVSHEHDHEQDSCSPFCRCSCCGTTTITISNNIHRISVAVIAINQFFSQPTSDITEVSLAIWQPPQSA